MFFIISIVRTLTLNCFRFSLFFLFISNLQALELPEGKFLQEIFTREEFKGSNQSWAIDFDKHGRVYVANTDELLIYDGVRWEKHSPPKMGILRSVVVSQSGKVYLGGQNSLGYYYPSETGNWNFKSLNTNLPISTTDVGAIRRGLEFNGRIYFKATDHILEVLSDDSIITYKGNVGWVSGDSKMMWRQTPDEGIVKIDSNGQIFPIFDKLPEIAGVFALADSDLAFTQSGGIFLIENKQIQTIHNPLVQNSRIIEVSEIPGGIALSTWNKGLIIVNKQGETIRHIEYKGTSALSTRYSRGALWVGFYGAIMRIPWPIFLQQYDYDFGLRGSAKMLESYQGESYVGTLVGLHKLNRQSKKFEIYPLGGSTSYVWAMQVTPEGMLIATHAGLFFVNDNSEDLLFAGDTKSIIPVSSLASHYFVTSLTRGSLLVKVADGKSEVIATYPEFKIDKQTAIDPGDGSIWVGTRNDGIYKLIIDDSFALHAEHLSAELIANGSTGNTLSYLFKVDDKILVSAFGRVCEPKFLSVPQCDEFDLFGVPLTNIRFIENNQDDSLIVATPTSYFLMVKDPDNGKYVNVNSPLDNVPAKLIQFFKEFEGDTWMGRTDGLWKFEKSKVVAVEKPKSWIRQVIIDDKIYYSSAKFLSKLETAIPPNVTKIRFSFGTNQFADFNTRLWRSKLNGYEKTFNKWSEEGWRDFTELSPGDYEIIVELKDPAGIISQSQPLQLTILAPWYLSHWAKIIYILIVLLLFFMTAKFYSERKNRRLIRRQSELEHEVNERTLELNTKQKKLIEQANKLTELDRAKSRFFANITHEFRTPLTLMIGPLTDLLHGRFGDLNKGQKKPIKLALERSSGLMELIEELLDISRLDAGVLVLHAQLVDVIKLVNQSLAQLDSWSESKNIDIVKEINCNHFEAVADSRQLERVFYNLIGNAIKFTPENGKVKIIVNPVDNGIAITIADSGVGIEPEEISRVFERFHQVSKSQISNPGGVGLGLSLAKEITDLHSGKLSVESISGEGARFTLYLPQDTKLVISDAVTANNKSAISNFKQDSNSINELNELSAINISADNISSRTTVLVVEDDSDLRTYICEHLADSYNVIESVNGQKGLENARRALPDLILSDVMMPVMDGVTMCEKLKSDPETDFIPIILLTAKAEDNDRIEGYEIGADDYLAKPFNTEVLKSRVANLILSRRKLLSRASESQVNFIYQGGLVNRDLRFVERLKQAIQNGLSDSELSVEIIADKLNMDRSTLYTKVQSIFKSTPSEMIRQARLKWAKELVFENKGTISDVAFTVGYATVAHFSQSFKKEFGCTPSQFRLSSSSSID